MKGGPEVGGLRGDEMKIAGKDGDDYGGCSSSSTVWPITSGSSTITLLPGGVAEHGGAWSGEKIFAEVKIASEDGSYPKSAEKTVGDASGSGGLRAFACASIMALFW